jgi:hypothetical protein
MSKNKLMEAAADILSGSKKSAATMPMEKMPGEVVDLGGPTPQNSKPDDDSNKIHATKAAKSATAPTTKPSAASADTQSTMRKVAEEEEIEDVSYEEDIEAMFGDDSTISEEFRTKATTIFEARVHDRVSQIQEELESQYAGMLEEAIDEIKSDLTEKVDDYLSYVVEQWIAENEIAIDSGLRSELTEEFIAGLRNLFAEHYIDVPEDKVDLVDELAGKVEELEGKLNEEIERGISFAKALVESRKNEVTREVCEGLTTTQIEKMKTLAESVQFSTEDEYKSKIESIRENYFPSGMKIATEEHLHEEVEDTDAKKVNIHDPLVAMVSQAISKTKF